MSIQIDRRGQFVAVIVPGAVGRDDQVAAHRLAALTLDIGVASFLGKDGAAGIRAVDVRRRDVAGRVDRDGAAHRGGDLQPAAEAGIGQKNALAIGEFDWRNIGATCDFVDAIEEWAIILPPPDFGRSLDLVGGDATAAAS